MECGSDEITPNPQEESVQQAILLPNATSEAECAFIQPLLTERQKEMISKPLNSGDVAVLEAIFKKSTDRV